MNIENDEIICYVFELFFQCINQVSIMIARSILKTSSTNKIKRESDGEWEKTYSRNRLQKVEKDHALNLKFNI